MTDFCSDLAKLRRGDYVTEDRRKLADRRVNLGGRPRRLTDRRLDWALNQIMQQKARRAIIEELGISMRTLERRLADRREADRIKNGGRKEAFLTFRCPDCWGQTRFPTCPHCNSIINAAFVALTDGTHERKLSP